MKDEGESYEYAAFSVLVYEFPGDDPKEADRKIRRKLTRKRLGKFDPERISVLRALKNELQEELGATSQPSRYFRGPTGEFASPTDFDYAGLLDELARRYGGVPRTELARIINIALFVNYMR